MEGSVWTASMTQDQAFAFAILIGLMVAFIWGRFRYDLIAVLALLAAVFTGIVPHKAAFSGFGDDIVIIVASALVVSAAIERSGVIEAFLHRVGPKVTSLQGQVVILVGAVTVLSIFIKNIGALSMMIPVAFQMARRSKASASSFLMPMAFGSLLGGLITLSARRQILSYRRCARNSRATLSTCLISLLSALVLPQREWFFWPLAIGCSRETGRRPRQWKKR
ncbi:hypothetical protein AJ87_35475 [Rhizobium yanglingense]|nr:hypothetical protein AJ87_35475 [Rhizobium yanglingense]